MANTYKLEPDEYYNIPDHLIGALERYLNNKFSPGGFLTAVLENDLSQSFARADIHNLANMRNIIAYVYNNMPSDSWGSPEIVNNWLNNKQTGE